jgi:hypothetical protein
VLLKLEVELRPLTSYLNNYEPFYITNLYKDSASIVLIKVISATPITVDSSFLTWHLNVFDASLILKVGIYSFSVP